nr:DUF6056 family protein [uncultured Eisenbergiella sp.]
MSADKNRRRIFYLTVVIATGMIFVFNLLTPMMSDDLFYGKEVSTAGSILGLIQQEYNQYMTWSGRSVSHLILRCFLTMDKMVFNICNSLVFMLLSLCIYWNIEHKKKYDVSVFVWIQLIMWHFSVVFRQTVLWETGACNYLWGSAIIMTFITCYRYALNHSERLAHEGLWAVLLPVLGILAGWCNENTSGGGLLFLLLVTAKYVHDRRGNKKIIRPWMISGLLGQLAGFMFMILAPGNFLRGQLKEEEHSGIFALVSRFQKIILAIDNNFLELLVIGLLLFVIIRCQKKSWREIAEVCWNGILWAFVFLATCFVLVLTPEPMPRAYFGAGIFLMTAVTQFFVDVEEKEVVFRSLKNGMLAVMCLIMFFTYMDSGADMARIYREYHEREVYLEEKAAQGETDVTIPLLRPDFETVYSDGYNSDIQEEPEYWINVAYAGYYGFESVSGVQRAEWTEY